MMTFAELSLAVLVLLVTPGPTNTLLFLAGSERGMLRALRLIPAEVAGYLSSVVPLLLIGTALMRTIPAAQTAITLLAAVWVAILAARLFRQPTDDGTASGVTARLVYVTTFLNPKALIFGLVLLPGPTAPLNVALFVGLVALVATGWAAAGAGLARRTAHAMPTIRRIAALWLAFVAATLIVRGLSA